jgi:Lysophospholipase L1 and related esterases
MKRTFLSLMLVLFVLSMTAQNAVNDSVKLATINAAGSVSIIDTNKVNINDRISPKTRKPLLKSGSTRKGSNPVALLIGDSTVRNGWDADGSNGQWGWGEFFGALFDSTKITIENHALGGTSSRTFYNNQWAAVKDGIQAGDFVLIQFGHNDGGPYDSGRARASIPGIGHDSLQVIIKETGAHETVYSYGEYLRKFVVEIKAKRAFPIMLSFTPRNAWDGNGHIVRANTSYGKWARQIAEEEKIPFVDLNSITAAKFDAFGPAKVNEMFYADHIHTSEAGAQLNAASVAEGIQVQQLPLAKYLKNKPKNIRGAERKGNKPLVFVIGDSTVHNKDEKSSEDSWGWGSLLANFLDEKKINVENDAMAGRSSRTFIDEGRWDAVCAALKPGDFLFIQFGHNDSGAINTEKARGTIAGNSDDSKVYKMETTKRNQVVHSYGWYIRKYIRDARLKGATPIVISPVPRNRWKDGKVERNEDSYGKWAKEAAEQEGAFFMDVNKLVADKFDAMGHDEVSKLFMEDRTHTKYHGALLNAKTIIDGMKSFSELELNKYVK